MGKAHFGKERGALSKSQGKLLISSKPHFFISKMSTSVLFLQYFFQVFIKATEASQPLLTHSKHSVNGAAHC